MQHMITHQHITGAVSGQTAASMSRRNRTGGRRTIVNAQMLTVRALWSLLLFCQCSETIGHSANADQIRRGHSELFPTAKRAFWLVAATPSSTRRNRRRR